MGDGSLKRRLNKNSNLKFDLQLWHQNAYDFQVLTQKHLSMSKINVSTLKLTRTGHTSASQGCQYGPY